jgi:hypothetical protein
MTVGVDVDRLMRTGSGDPAACADEDDGVASNDGVESTNMRTGFGDPAACVDEDGVESNDI